MTFVGKRDTNFQAFTLICTNPPVTLEANQEFARA